MPKSNKIEKKVQITSFKAKKGKNKYTMIGWWINGSQHLKTLLIAIEAKALTRYGQKVDFFIQLSDQIKL